MNRSRRLDYLLGKLPKGLALPAIVSRPLPKSHEQKIAELVEEFHVFLRDNPKRIGPRRGAAVIACIRHFTVSVHELIRHNRFKNVCLARAELMWMLRNRCTMSYTAIATMLERNHSTVMWQVKKIQHEIDAGIRKTPNWFEP